MKFPDIYQLPLYTIDSSTWVGGMKFGKITYFDKKKGLVTYTVKEFRSNPSSKIFIQIKIKWLDMGFSFSDLTEDKYFKGSHSFNMYITIDAYIDFFYYCQLYNRNFFFVCEGFHWLACLSAMLSSRNRFGKVKYEYTKKTIKQLIGIYKSKQPLTLLKEILS